MSRAIRTLCGLAALVALGIGAAPPAGAQGTGGAAGGDTIDAAGSAGPVSPDSADALRAAMERPDAGHPIRLGRVLHFPLRVVTWPVDFTVTWLVKLAGYAVDPETVRPLTRAYRALRSVGVRPSLSTELGPRSGLAASVDYVGLSPLRIEVGGSVRGYQRHRLALEWSGDHGRASLGGTFRRDASQRFWGVGQEALESNESDFRLDRVSAVAALAWRPGGAVELGLEAGVEENSVARGFDDGLTDLQDVFDESALSGADHLTRFWRVAARGEVDLIDRDTLDLAGARAGLRAERYQGVDGTRSDFTRLAAWVHGFVPVDRRNVLALRARSEVIRDSGRGVPFFHLSTLGGNEGLRSFDWGRFRDRDLLLLTAEWRYEVWRDLRERGRAEWFLFWDEGGVARSLHEISATASSYGFGLNAFWRGRSVAHGLVAFGEEGTRFTVSFSPTF